MANIYLFTFVKSNSRICQGLGCQIEDEIRHKINQIKIHCKIADRAEVCVVSLYLRNKKGGAEAYGFVVGLDDVNRLGSPPPIFFRKYEFRTPAVFVRFPLSASISVSEVSCALTISHIAVSAVGIILLLPH